MKRRFESNIAVDLPKTRSNEPNLPWKLSDEDLDRLKTGDGARAGEIASPPLRTRAIFPILLVLAIFVLLSQFALDVYLENNNIQQSAQQSAARKEGVIASLQADVAKLAGEKEKLGENASRLEKKIEDLNEQKELFTAALESLTKKNDEIIIEAPSAPAPADSGKE